MPFAGETVTSGTGIPYSWQVSRIGPARQIEKLKEFNANMKTIRTSRIYLPMAAMILTAALGTPAAAQTQVPFNGAFQGNDTVTPPTLAQSITGIGNHLGQFTSTAVLTLTASGGTGSAHWIAANGDSFETTVVGSPEYVPTAPCQVVGAQPQDSYAKITEIHTITGGTGRFAGIQGSFTLTLYHDVVPRSDGTHGTCGSYSGTITPPGAAS
jgi:hypothetical protein